MPDSFFQALEHAEASGTSDCLVDVLLSELDQAISSQVNAIMHHPAFQALERSWRSLRFLVDHIDFSQNIRLVFMNLSKSDLAADFEDSPDITRSGLYKQVYTAEYGQFGGQPIAAIIADYDFDPSAGDMELLHQAARVGAMAHAPFIASADVSFFDIASWRELASLESLRAIFELPKYAAWNRFRDAEAARYAVLTLPLCLLRLPYGTATVAAESFAFEEDCLESSSFCWGSAAHVVGVRMAESFSEYRWCTNLTGVGNAEDKLRFPVYDFRSTRNIQNRIPTSLLVSEAREHELSEEGFMALVLRKGMQDAAFFSANSCSRVRRIRGANAAEREEELGLALAAQLPYMMIVNRLAHYVKVIQRDSIGAWKDALSLERELNRWISQYVTEMDDPDPVTRSRRPLRKAKIYVLSADPLADWYTVGLQVQPHFKYLGAAFTLSLMSRLEK